MMDDGKSRLQEFLGLKKSGVICATSRMPQDSSINLPQTCANSALAVPTAAGAGNTTHV